MPAYGGPRYPIVQLLHQIWPRRSTIAELVPHCATPGEFSVPHHPEGPSPGSLKNITPLTAEREQPVLLAHRPGARKAEALAQPQLARIAAHPVQRLDDLLPWNWNAA